MPERWRTCASRACRIRSFLGPISMILTPVVIGHVAPAAPAMRGQTELAHGVNNAPGLGVNRAPALGVDYAPILSADRAPVPGVNRAPALGVDCAPALGVDQAPSPGVDRTPDLGMHSSLLHHVQPLSSSLGTSPRLPLRCGGRQRSHLFPFENNQPAIQQRRREVGPAAVTCPMQTKSNSRGV